MPNRIEQLLKTAVQRLPAQLAPANNRARLEAELLLSHVIGKPRSYLWAWPEQPLSTGAITRFQQLVEQRRAGTPIAYLVGKQAFWQLTLTVTPAVLIPRPDTECLVEQALSCPVPEQAVVADLGTGSGAIALALASERPHWQVLAVDNQLAALAVARANCARHRLSNVALLGSHWGQSLGRQTLHMIVTNPPYIPADDPHLQQGDVRFEPRSALVSGKDGLAAIRVISQQATTQLLPNGWLLLEHGYDQGAVVRTLLQAAGFNNVTTHRDLASHERVTQGQLGTGTPASLTDRQCAV